MKLRVWLTLGLLVLGAPVAAQEVPNSPDYHARHNPQSVYYQGPGQQGQQQPLPPQPTGWWEKTWGAIAGNPKTGILGSALGAGSEAEATRRAISDCESKGGGTGCRVEIAYHNQCAVLVVDDEASLTARAASIEEAARIGLSKCTAEGGSNCRVFYSACTEPIFHRY